MRHAPPSAALCHAPRRSAPLEETFEFVGREIPLNPRFGAGAPVAGAAQAGAGAAQRSAALCSVLR